mmetsp:Transcript_92050/g.168719  ORF Transcript_92050/g.168719 Transcript_92050/m.168719 type:complete len:519 (-) Transcript_92050:82-1638(-)
MPGAVEVRLDAVQGITPPPDTFVGMRVGDVQKQSRFGTTRTYRFPDPGDKRASFGRIEVFKRIGSLTVNLEKSNQECQVPCHYPNFDGLKVKVNVKSNEEWERPATREKREEKRSKAKQRLDAANAYVHSYRLEELLAEAMREVIRHKPSNPHRFLANYILDHAEERVLPVVKDATSGKSETQMMPSASKIAPFEVTRIAPMPVERAAPAPPPRPMSRGEKLPPIHHQDMRKWLPPAEPPMPLKAAVPPTPSKAPAPVTVPQESRISVSPAAWLLPTNEQVISSTTSGLPQSILPMKWYYASNFAGSVAPAICSKLFPAKSQPAAEVQVLGQAEPQPAAEVQVLVQAEPAQTKMASLRTQLRGALFEATRNGDFERTLSEMKPIQVFHKPQPFKFLPSVGTWCALRVPEEEPPPGKPNFKRLPSVCTWLARAPLQKNLNRIQEEEVVGETLEVNDEPFRHRASVGTWLMKPPKKVERPWYLRSFDASDQGEFVSKLQAIIAEKDKELEKLQAQLASLQ